jgi:hypothetical protein
MIRSPSRTAVLGLCLVLASLPALAQQTVYQWKDAKGVTHFSDSPPPKAHTTRTMAHRDGTPAPQPVAAPAEDPQCTTARANLAHLQGDAPVGFDADKDGKADRAITAEERASQARYAEAAIQVHCAPAAAGADAGAEQ